MFDLLIRNGRVLDGTGGPWFRADVAVADDRIAALGPLGDCDAGQIIDASGRFVCPGFVEEHSHADVCFMVDPLAQSAVRQGMTTMVVGHCGKSAAPVDRDMLEVYRRPEPFYKYDGLDWTWETMAEYLDTVRAAQPSVNVVTLVGHLPVRQLVMGEANRPANPEERAAMRELVGRALSEGARGFSTGLTEHHSVFADTDEVVGIAQALGGTGWAYHCHMRNYTRNYLAAIREAIEIAERAGVPLVISHMYPAGRENWGQAEAGIGLVEQARDRGLEAGFDVTPWRRGGGPFSQTLPQWVREGGIEATLARLREDEARRRVARELEEDPTTSILPEWDDWLVCLVGRPENRGWLGRSIGAIAAERGQAPADAALRMLVEDDGGYLVAPTIKSDVDVDRLLKHPQGVPTADGFALAPEGPLAN